MRRRPTGHLLRWSLATMILVAGFGSPVRYGHAHAYHGDHDHHSGADDGGHDHFRAPADPPAWECVAFHWHDTFAPPGGLPAPATDATPVQVVGSAPWMVWGVTPGASALVGPDFLLLLMASASDALLALRLDIRIPSESMRLSPPHLRQGSVPIRC